MKADLQGLNRKKLVELVSKILDAESLLTTVGMVHWYEYEDLFSKDEKIKWIEIQPTLRGTPWENFKNFLIKTKDIEFTDILCSKDLKFRF